MASNFSIRPLLFFAFLLSVSCETIVDIDMPVKKPMVVMNSLVNPDSAWSVRLTFSEYVLNTDTTRFVEDADVTVFDEEDELIVTLQYDKRGYYRSNQSTPEAGRFYKIIANVPGYDLVEGSTLVPAYPNVFNATARITTFNYQPVAFYTVEIQDPSTYNYYEVFAENVDKVKISADSIGYRYSRIYIESDDPTFNTEILDFEVGLMFSDKLFSEPNIKLFLKTYQGGPGVSSSAIGTKIQVRSLSQEYYNYATTLKLQFKISSDPLAQPVEVKSNIKNGLGLVAGVSQSNFFIPRLIPVITAFTPTSGRPGDIVTLEGENLYGDFSNTQVWFFSTKHAGFSGNSSEGRAPARIIEKTATRLSIVVPAGAKTNPILIDAFGTLRISTGNFTVIE
jgi:hypothetical protein